jgi:integrase
MGRLSLGDGKRKYVYGKTEEEVLDRMHDLKSDLKKGLPIVSDKRTVEDFLAEWLETVAPRLQPTTYARYEVFVRRQIVPEIGKEKLSKLTPQQVQRLYSTWRGRGLSSTSVKHLHTVLHNALSQAVKWDYVGRNVTDLVDKPKAATREMHTLNRDEVSRFLEAARGDRLWALYVLALSTGMRQGELLALRWSNVDLDGCAIQVRGTMQPTKDGLRISVPKTKASKRRVQLAPRAVEALRWHRAQQNEERLRLGKPWPKLDLVFPNELGEPMTNHKLLRGSFYPLLQGAGLQQIRFHELRHSAASLQLEAGTPLKVVQEMLGHSTSAITLDLYAHVTPTMQDRAAQVADDILAGVASSSGSR